MEHRQFRELAFNPFRNMVDLSKSFPQKAENYGELDDFSEEQIRLVAEEVFKWAKEHGVTHYTFWIQPQTNQMIEKHDAFLELEHLYQGFLSSKNTERFTGKILQKGEGDGSSFPNGGLRGTQKARAYIAWDSKSDIFIREGINKTLYIPAMLLTHTGQALDEKSYLRRAEAKLKESTSRLLRQLGERDVKYVSLFLGVEQQFFILRKQDYEARADLKQTGRCLYGELPPRNQQFSDHYYGRINEQIFEILNECENKLLRLGVPIKTKHKEVAINQYEISAFYEDAVTSCDHNMLVMETIKEVFDKNGYVALFHEKPFKGANGSGKHCNWSIQYAKGKDIENLFEPGDKPSQNVKFILFMLITLKAVQKNAGLLKASITSASNEHRMGGHEAPPCIISVFLGSYIDKLLDSIEQGTPFTENPINLAKMIPGLRKFMQDNTDRNRTSPFAFTGNKFEFRAVGSKQNVSFPMTVIAAMMAQQTDEIANQLERGFDVWDIIKNLIKETKNIRFEGDGYSAAWEEEAAKRGLPHLKTAKESFECIKNATLLRDLDIFSECELAARYNIVSKQYEQIKVAEGKTMKILIEQHFLPRILKHLERLAQFKNSSKRVFLKDFTRFEENYEKLSEFTDSIDGVIKEVQVGSTTEERLDKATELRHKLDEVSKYLSRVEASLPKEEGNLPQLYEMLNTY